MPIILLVFTLRFKIEADEDEFEYLDLEFNEVLDLSKVKEMRLIPLNASHLDTLFCWGYMQE